MQESINYAPETIETTTLFSMERERRKKFGTS